VPLVASSPVSFECKLSQIVQVQDHRGVASDNWLVMGQVVGVHIDSAFILEGVYDTVAASPILRGGGPGDYFSIRPSALFVMLRPRANHQESTAVSERSGSGGIPPAGRASDR
jgi:flavin reductase (DIM6/NTAB) family NADH-FMN oxidoreductase RutF